MTRDGISQSPPFYLPAGGPFPNYDTGAYQGIGVSSSSVCLHDGVPHVAWTEMYGVPPFSSANPGIASGPFVARWNGAGWDGVGMTIGGGTPSPFELDGDTFLILQGPSAPDSPHQRLFTKLASDGTNLYLCYLAQMLSISLFLFYDSIHQEDIYAFGYGYWLRVWKYDGGGWSLLGVNETAINNRGLDFGNILGPVISADPAGVGSCYVSYFETGRVGVTLADAEIANFWFGGFGADSFLGFVT